MVTNDNTEEEDCAGGCVTDDVATEVDVCDTPMEGSWKDIVEEAALIVGVSEGSNEGVVPLATLVLSEILVPDGAGKSPVALTKLRDVISAAEDTDRSSPTVVSDSVDTEFGREGVKGAVNVAADDVIKVPDSLGDWGIFIVVDSLIDVGTGRKSDGSLLVTAGKGGRLCEAVVRLGIPDTSLAIVTCSTWLLLLSKCTVEREAVVPVTWLEIAVAIPLVMIDDPAIVSLGSRVRGLLSAVELGREADEGAGCVPSIVLVAGSGDDVTGGANVEEASIDDTALDDAGNGTSVESSGIDGAMRMVDSIAALREVPIELELGERVAIEDDTGVGALEGPTETAGLGVGTSTPSDEDLSVELSC